MQAMRKWTRGGIAGLVMGIFGAATASAEPIAWTAAAGGSWHTPGNWDLNRVPASGDDVVIPSGSGSVTFDSGTTSINTIASNRPLSINGGTLNIEATSVISAPVALAGGTLGGAGDVTAAGNMAWTNGTISGTGTLIIPSGATLMISGPTPFSKYLSKTIHNFGTTDWTGIHVQFNGGTFHNKPSGVLNAATSGGAWYGNSGINTIYNEGIINRSGTGIAYLEGGGTSMTITNAANGQINVLSGELRIDYQIPVFINEGTIDTAAGAILTFFLANLNLNGGSFGGAGLLQLNNVTVNHATDFHTADWDNYTLSACTFNGPGHFINDRAGGFALQGGAFNTLVKNQTVLSTLGTAFNAGLQNPAGATLRILTDNLQLIITSIAGGFTNNGTVHLISFEAALRVTGGPLVNNGLIEARREGSPQGNRFIIASINNSGTITNVDVSDLRLGEGNGTYLVNNSGTINVTGGNLSNNSNYVSLTNTGTIAIAPGRTYSQSNGTTLNLNGGTIGGAGANLNLTNVFLNLTADFHTADWGNLSISSCTVNGPGTFINDAAAGFNPSGVTFNTLVDNRSSLSTYIGAFNAGLLNPVGSLLRILGDDNSTVTGIAGGFTNNGTVHIVSRGAVLSVTGGTMVNNGLIEARREGSPQGDRAISFSVLNNHGTITNLDVSALRLNAGTVNNSGTFNVLGGDLANWDGVSPHVGNNLLIFNNTGTVAIAPGRSYLHNLGTLNLTSGTFGGTGAILNLARMTVNHAADFHTADWASISSFHATFGGPGIFVNDHPAGFVGNGYSGGVTTFNTFVRNKTYFDSRACFFAAGFSNPLGATFRAGVDSQLFNTQSRFTSGFTNHGVIEIVDLGASIATMGPAPNYTMHTLTNSPTGHIHVRRLGTAPGHRGLACNIANYGVLTVHDADLLVGVGNYFMLINNYGIFNLDGGNLVFGNAPFNKAWINNYGVLNIGEGRTINQPPGGVYPPLVFRNLPGAILSGSGIIFGGEGGPTVDNKIEINGIVRPGGENAVGTLTLAGNVSVPALVVGNLSHIAAIIELDIGAAGGQAHDQFIGLSGLNEPEHGGRYVSVNVIGSNLPPPGDGIPLDGWPFVASNLTVFDGGICVGCLGGGGPGTACGGTATVLAACPGPTITQQPQSIAPCPGDTISLSVVATGADPLTYQWQKINTSVVNLANGPTGNGSTISGADGPTLTISSLAAADLGSYAVVVSDANGSRISTLATLVGGCVINVTAATPQPFLDSLITPAATIVMQNVPDRPTLILPALTSLGGAMHLIGNGGLTNLQAALLATIGGGLDIRNNPLLTDVTLPALTTVTGDLDVSGNTGATAIDFPQLGGVGGEVTIHNNPLTTTIDFPQLGSVGGEVAIHNNPLTTTIAFPQLGGVGGEVTIHNNPLTTTIGFPQLGGVGGEVAIHNNLLTTTIDFPQLGSVGGDVTVFNNPAATVVGLGSLQTVVGSVSIRNNLALAAVSMPLLTDVDGGVDVSGNTAATAIDLGTLGSVGGSFEISGNPSANTLDLGALGSVGGSFEVSGNPGASVIDLGALGSVGGSFEVSGNPGASTINLGALGSVGGSFDVSGNPGATTVGLGSLQTVVGSMSIRNNLALAAISMPLLTDVDGGVDVSGNTAATTIDLGTLVAVGEGVAISDNQAAQNLDLGTLVTVGDGVAISDNPSATTIDLGSLVQVGEGVTISDNPAAQSVSLGQLVTVGEGVSVTGNSAASTIDMSSLGSVGGSVAISDNTGASAIDVGALGSVGGSVAINDNTAATTIDLGTLGGVGESIAINDNTAAQSIDLGTLGGVGGSVAINDNPAATNIALDSLTTVGGDLTLETQGQSDVDLSAAAVAGNTDISSTGATSVEVQTPGGTTSVEMCNDAACMDADLPDNAAPDGTPFAILRVDPQTLGRVPGLDETGQPAGIDPVAAYAFTLGAPLQGPASLVFDLTLASLSPGEQAAVLDAYADGRLTLTVQGDNPGDAPQARAQCGPSDPLVADGCVKVGAFDALGFQLPPGVTAGAATIRIAALVSHFSTYAVSIVTGRGDMNCDGEIDLADVEPFLQALTDPAGYAAAHPACPALGADMNQDGAANGLDIARFTAAVLPAP